MYYNLLFISWLFVAEANDCFYGGFETNNLGDCVLNCNQDDQKYVAKESVTWDQLMHSCYNVRRGSQLGDCSSLTDLVWSDNCVCPYCKCTPEDTSGIAVTLVSFDAGDAGKTCYNCTCVEHPYDTTFEGFLFDCDYVDSVSSAYRWTDFTCPVQTCTDGNDNERRINEGWFTDAAGCTEYCYCGAGAAKVCVTGFEAILASDNAGLVAAFNRDCEYYTPDCLDEPARLFSTSTAPNCYCPRCNCGTYTVADTWWTEYDDDESDQTVCRECTCEDGGTDEDYADCSDNSVEYTTGHGDCPPTKSVKCHSGDNSYSTDPGTPVTVGTLNSETCWSTTPENYCQWTYEHDVEKENGVQTDEEWSINWGCEGSPFCTIFDVSDSCIYGEYSVSYTDCSGDTTLKTTKEYLYCCNADENCNHQDIDISTCTEETQYGEYYNKMYECIFGNYFELNCDIDQYENQTVTCDKVKSAYLNRAKCTCEFYADLYSAADDTWKSWMDAQLNGGLSGMGKEWNDPLNCNINIKCKLGSGEAYNDEADSKVYFMGVVFTAIAAMMIN